MATSTSSRMKPQQKASAAYPPTRWSLVAKHGFQSPIQAANALITAKRMFKRVLEEVARDTVETDAEVAEEIRELKRILSR